MTVIDSSPSTDGTNTALAPSPTPAAGSGDGHFSSRGWLVLLTLCCATFMCGLDFSIVTVALPDIGTGLGFSSVSTLQWVATASLLPSASLLPLFARVSDLVGRKRLFTLGVTLFIVFSLTAALAGSPGAMIAARVGQGSAAAMIAPAAIALMTGYFPEGTQRTRALGLNGAVMSLGFVLGALGGGVITSGFSWRWTMVVLCAMGVLALAGALALPAVQESTTAQRMDIPGALLATLGLFGMVYGVSTGADQGWTDLETLGTVIGGVVLLIGFLLVELRHPAPLIPLNVLNRPTIKWAGLLGVVTFGMCAGATVLLSLYMQEVLGFSPLSAGLSYLGEGAAAMIGGLFVGRLLAHLPGAVVLAGGLAVQGVGTLSMLALPDHLDLPVLLITSSVMGLGHVLSVVSFITVMTTAVSAADQGSWAACPSSRSTSPPSAWPASAPSPRVVPGPWPAAAPPTAPRPSAGCAPAWRPLAPSPWSRPRWPPRSCASEPPPEVPPVVRAGPRGTRPTQRGVDPRAVVPVRPPPVPGAHPPRSAR